MVSKSKEQALLFYLQKNGKTTAKVLSQILKLSQASLSRILSSIRDKIVVMGKARETAYAVIREIDDLPQTILIFEISKIRKLDIRFCLINGLIFI